MSGCLQQRWVSYAGDDAEAWKVILLSRSLKRSLTTRPMYVVISDKVSLPMGRRLQEEVEQTYWVDPDDFPGLQFRSVAKLCAQRWQGAGVHKTVFLDANTLVVKNVDELFRKGERSAHVQWVGAKGQDFAAIFVKSRAIGKKEQKLATDLVVQKETRDKIANGHDDSKLAKLENSLEKFDYALPLDLTAKYPAQLPGNDLKLICFTNGHPQDVGQGEIPLKSRGDLEQEIIRLCVQLCPELYTPPPKLVKDYEIPWELNNSVAVIGMACRYPCANTIDEFWKLLDEGKEGIRKVPEGRWTKDNCFLRMDNLENTEAGFLSCPIDTFDAKFFNTNMADMNYLDPQQRLSLRVVWEALEHAGIDPNTLKESLTGVFGGWWRNDYKEMLQTLGIVDQDFLRGYMGNALGPLTARISHFFELIGPSFSTESGCSTSVAGVDMACDSLRNDACDLAIAVGANLLIHPFSPKMMEGVLAPDGRCKTFDSSADGFGRAEGIGVLILKRFSNAVADGDRIWGVIRGSAIVQEGPSKSMGTPTVDVEAKAMQLALERSGVDPEDVEFVETHGTGTPVGDPIEVAAVAKAYSAGGRKNILTIGSVKTNIGHTESVCGIAGIQKSLLSMKYETIPKHLHIKNLNPEIDLNSMQAQLPINPIPWKRRRGGKPRIAGVNSFGITGAQAHVLVQETPEQLPPHQLPFKDTRGLKMLTFSAKTEDAFKAQVKAYINLLKSEAPPSLTDLEYSMHTGRSHFPLRSVVMGSSHGELISAAESIKKPTPAPNTAPKLCFLFTGQGSQYVDMSKELYGTSAIFRSVFDWAEAILQKEWGYGLKAVLWGKDGDKLKTTLYSQTAIFVVELGLLRLWESWGLTPDAVLGHSLGEFAAAVAAGIISDRDALSMVAKRSKLIDALPKSSMLVVMGDLDSVQLQLEKAFQGQKKWLDTAAINSPSQTVVAGATEVVMEFKDFCEKAKIKTHLLESSHAFHSKFMDPILEEYGDFTKKITFNAPKKGISYISSVDGKVISSLDSAYWIRHARQKVRFVEASQSAVREGLSLFLEIGPHPVLSALLLTNTDEIADAVAVPSLRRKTGDWATMLSTLASIYGQGVPINWKNFHRYSGGQKIDLPGYHFEETPYWMSIKDEGATPFHPLVGAFVPNPSDVTIFKSSVNVQRLPFLKDHALGDKIIFPCVGYVDMCLTAGYAATQCSEGQFIKPATPLCVRNFSIHTPVCLSELFPTEFQVVVAKQPEGDVLSTIYTKVFLESNSFKWVKNASATFSSTPPPPQETVTGEFAEIQSRCSELVREYFDYKELEEFGFNFGPTCRTVHKAFRNPNDHGEWLFPFRTHETEEDHARFFIHPWCTDPLLQTQILASGLINTKQIRKRLVVPVAIDNFTWWGNSAPSGFVYLKNREDKNEAHLFDPNGKLMVSMVDTTYMDTTLSNILALIESQKNPFPSLAEYAWREKLGPEERRIPELEKALNLKELATTPEMSKEEEANHKTEEQLCGLYILKAFKELGGDQKESIWPQIVKELNVLPHLDKFVHYLLQELVSDGWLSKKGESYKITKSWPQVHEIRAQIGILLKKLKDNGLDHIESVSNVWDKLGDVLTGRQQPLSLLFPEGAAVLGPAELYYTKSLFASTRHHKLEEVDKAVLTKLATTGNKSVVRILEVGAGTGSSTVDLIKHMNEAGSSHFEYTFTDLSQSFLNKGEALFQDTTISSKFALLDIEKDPLEQGFIPGHYDVIVASWVLHATASLSNSLANIRRLLRPGGYVLITELTAPTRPINLLYGGLEGFWRFSDKEIREWNCELGIPGWEKLLGKMGFGEVTSIPICNGTNAYILAKFSGLKNGMVQQNGNKANSSGKTWLLFGDQNDPISTEFSQNFQSIGYSVQLVPRTQLKDGDKLEEQTISLLKSLLGDKENSKNIEGILYTWGLNNNLSLRGFTEPFVYMSKYLVKSPHSLKVIVLTRGNMCTGASDHTQSLPHPSTLIAVNNVLGNENPGLGIKSIDLDPGLDIEHAVKEAFCEIFTNDVDVNVAFRKGQRCTPRLRPYKVKSAPLPIPRTPRIRLQLPASHLIQDLQFVSCEPEPVGDGEVEIEVKSYALNFLDVLMVTKPDPVFEKYNYLGVDIAGIISAVAPGSCRKVGDRVVLIRRNGMAMPSHLVAPDYRTLIIPDDVTYEEAATFPMGMLTVASCLVDTAKAQKGDVVLFHTASGGVGLLGIQIAQRIGCTIVVTAGNERKRQYLRSLGIKYVFNSRTTDYAKDIRAALGGRGVDIVLNSLTGEGFKEATLELCNPKARFIEMSKMNIWNEEDVRGLRPDVFYKVIDVSTHSEEKITELSNYLQAELLRDIKDRPKPLPMTRFDAADIRDALEYMEKVKHIGKIVLTMPESGVCHLFNAGSSYMITGGLGGIGLEVGKWMTTNGAKTLLLLGRSAPKQEALDKIELLRSQGIRVEIRAVDVGDRGQMEELFKEFGKTLPPLRGIMHAAGLLDDATLDKQDWGKFERSFRCKIDGAWNLHNLSLNQPFPLEHFVLFSSVTATVGGHGQANYVAANQFLDALAHYRNSIGLPATAIDWGQWGQVGLAANMHVPMNKPMTIHQGIAALEHAIKSHKTQIVAHETDLPAIKQVLISTRGLLADIEEDSSGGQGDIDGDEFWREYDAADGNEDEVVRKFLKRIIRMTLKLEKNEEVEDNVNFGDMGMDSLMMVELKNGLQASVGKRVKISFNAVRDCKTVAQLSARLVELISGKVELPPPTEEELRKLVEKDAKLTEEIKVDGNLKKTLVPLHQLKTVMIVGATGTVGPYVLREIFKRPSIQKVYVLMQQSALITPEERFTKIFEKKGLLSSIPMDKVVCIPGNVSEIYFGLGEGPYTKLACECEAIFNLAVKVAFDEIYRETGDPKSARSINVFGMHHVLTFATDRKLKHVYHASTFAAITAADKDGMLWEDWPKMDEIKALPHAAAYSVSKLICDLLAEQGVARGIPIKVFRMPQIGGDSDTGENAQLDSFLLTRCMSYLYTGKMHGSPIPLSLMAVNECARLSVDLFFNPATKAEVYNVLNPHLGNERDFDSLAKQEFGIDVKVLELNEFVQLWKESEESENEDEMVRLVKLAMEKDGHIRFLRDKELPYYTNWLNGNQKIFWSKKIEKLIPKEYPSCITPSWEVLKNDLKFAKKSGLFDRYKINGAK